MSSDWESFGRLEAAIEQEARISEDDIETLRLIESAVQYLDDTSDVDSAIASCVAPESVGRSRSEIPVSDEVGPESVGYLDESPNGRLPDVDDKPLPSDAWAVSHDEPDCA